jgi:hypothetical protein
VSHLYFHTLHGDIAVKGVERGHLERLGERAGAMSITPLSAADEQRLASLLQPDNFFSRGAEPGTAWVSSAVDGMADFNSRILVRNSAILHGSDQVRLAVRLNAQCEIHSWVDGPNRAWLADIIEAGLDRSAYYRSGGWLEVIEFLRIRDDEPVVTSSSLAGVAFPNAYLSTWRQSRMPEGWVPDGISPAAFTMACRKHLRTPASYWADLAEDQFESLPVEERWAHGMAALRADNEYLLELRPEDWTSFRFNHGLTLQDLLADDYADRLDAALDGYEEDED